MRSVCTVMLFLSLNQNAPIKKNQSHAHLFEGRKKTKFENERAPWDK